MAVWGLDPHVRWAGRIPLVMAGWGLDPHVMWGGAGPTNQVGRGGSHLSWRDGVWTHKSVGTGRVPLVMAGWGLDPHVRCDGAGPTCHAAYLRVPPVRFVNSQHPCQQVPHVSVVTGKHK